MLKVEYRTGDTVDVRHRGLPRPPVEKLIAEHATAVRRIDGSSARGMGLEFFVVTLSASKMYHVNSMIDAGEQGSQSTRDVIRRRPAGSFTTGT